MLFIFNGAVYFRREEKFELKSQGKWYNVVLGLALLGVISLPHEEFEFPHYLFAGIFFLGNVFVIAFLHNKKQRVFRAILAILTILSLAFHFIFGWISLFWGEWLSLAVIGIHFILEARNVKR
jgi:hypothetical membrane protein